MYDIEKEIRLKIQITSILLICFFVTACAPSESAIATAIAQTETSMPTNTSTPLPTPTITPMPTSTPVPTYTTAPLLASIAGIWTGVDKGTVGGDPRPGREVGVTLLAECALGQICGSATTIVNDELCLKDLILVEAKKDELIFIFEGSARDGSAAVCSQGGTYTLQSLPDGTLSYALDGFNDKGLRIKKTAILERR